MWRQCLSQSSNLAATALKGPFVRLVILILDATTPWNHTDPLQLLYFPLRGLAVMHVVVFFCAAILGNTRKTQRERHRAKLKLEQRSLLSHAHGPGA